MQQYKKKVYLFLAFIYSPLIANSNVSPYIRIRSQGTNAARALQGWTPFIHRTDCTELYQVLAVTPSYSKSNKAGRMAENLFGRVVRGSKWDVASLTIAGSGVEDRNKECDLFADYFGLPRDYKSEILLKPRIDNFIAELDWYLGLDNFAPGLWMRVRMPITYTRWDLNYCEEIKDRGTANHQPGYFNDAVTLGTEDPAGTYANAFGVSRSSLLKNFTDYIAHQQTPDLGRTVIFNPLCNARFIPVRNKKRRQSNIADLHIDLGYDAWRSERYHVGFGLSVVGPTGNRPEGVYAFEPIVGNGHHWECGALFSSHVQLWHDTIAEQQLNLWINAQITHLFSTRQRRTFDLRNKPNSRYMLAQRMTRTVQDLFTNSTPGDVSGSTPPSIQFNNLFTPVANLTTIDVDVSVGWQADAVIMLSYTKERTTWDAGYNIWGHSCESISRCRTSVCALTNDLWALKGDAHVYGFSGTVSAPATDPIALSPSQSDATISRGSNNFTSLNTNLGGIDGVRPTRNPGIDDPAFARKTAGADGTAQNINDRPDNLGLQTKTSQMPIIITVDDLDLIGATTKGLSHSFFAGFCYTWPDNPTKYTPYVAVGGQAEFHAIDRFCTIHGKHNCTICMRPQECSSCRFCGVSQWSVWLKVGVSTN